MAVPPSCEWLAMQGGQLFKCVLMQNVFLAHFDLLPVCSRSLLIDLGLTDKIIVTVFLLTVMHIMKWR
jgi:hypothetical protein